MIVEDSRIVAEDIRQKLIELGYTVTAVATSGEKALAAVELDVPDIALMDIELGDGINGIETATELRQTYQVPVIYLTAYTDEDTINRAKHTEPLGYIIKPFDDKELRSAIEIGLYKSHIEQKLKVSEEWLQTAMKSIGDGVIATDMKGNVTFINPVAELLTGWTKDEAIGKQLSTVFNIVNEGSREPSENPVTRVIKTGQIIGLANHTLLIARDGREVPISDSASPIVLNGDEKLGVILVFQDATESRRAEEELRESEERYRTIMEQAADAVFVHDQEGRIVDANNKACQNLGYLREELLSMSFWDIEPGGEGENRSWNGILKGEQKTFVSNHRRKDGTIFPVEVTLGPVNLKSGPAVLGIARDISERIRLESQIKHNQKMESIGNLAGGIAHDFNNILSSIIGFTELALEEVEKETTIEDSLQEVYAAGKRAKELVRQILVFARQSDETLKPVQVNSIVNEVVKFVRSSIPTTIVINNRSESDSLVMGSATRLHQVLMNMCTNAAHAMEDEGGALDISLKDVVFDEQKQLGDITLKPGDYIQIKLSDTGVGISPSVIGSIFEPYFTTKAPGEGTGMGLAMAHGIVENYGGKIVVESTLGIGTIFIIYLPITGKRKQYQIYESGVLPTGTESILFVDDEVSLVKMGSRGLEQLGYHVTTRTSSVEALELFQSKPDDFDLIITDMTMPIMTGDIMAKKMMGIRPDIPVILCTGYSKKISGKSAAELGIRALTYKPIVKLDLAKTVRKVLDDAKVMFP